MQEEEVEMEIQVDHLHQVQLEEMVDQDLVVMDQIIQVEAAEVVDQEVITLVMEDQV